MSSAHPTEAAADDKHATSNIQSAQNKINVYVLIQTIQTSWWDRPDARHALLFEAPEMRLHMLQSKNPYVNI
jgi:hypothetical protein